MSRVPSVTPTNIGEFVRRTRENALELSIVGGTRLQNQIQSLFGGVQVQNLPLDLQQIIAEDRALGGGGGTGPLTLTNPFTNDELSPDQQKAAANQMATQQGARPPFPEVQQPREQNSADEAARQASSNLQSLVDEGILTEKSQESITRSVALDRVLDANEQRKAARNVKAVLNQFRTKQLSQQQVATTMDRIQREHGNESLNLIPEWRELTNTNEQFQAQLNEAKEAMAAKHGLPLDAFKIDQQTGAIIKDEDWFFFDAYKTKKATEEAKPLLEDKKLRTKSAENNLSLRLGIANKNFIANSKLGDPVAAANRNAIEVGVANTRFIEELPGGDTSQPAPQAPPAASGLPPGVVLFGAFPDVQSVINASPPTGSYFTIGGVLGRRRADGRYEPVQ